METLDGRPVTGVLPAEPAETPAEKRTHRPQPTVHRTSGTRLKVWLAGSALVLGIAYLLLTSLQTSTVYYLTVGELLAKGPAAYGQQLRLAGDVTAGSVQKEDAGLGIRFLVEDGSGQIPVYYRGGPVPDIFGEQVQVVVEGKVGPDGTFTASTLLAKCPSKFETDATAGA